MLTIRFLLKIILLISFLFSFLSADEEENILFSTKGKSPTYSKVKYDKYGNRKSISFIKVDEDSEHLVEMEGLAIAKIKYDEKSKIFKVKEYDIDQTLLFTNKVKIKKDGFEQPYVTAVFSGIESKQAILDAMSRPAEKVKPWFEYRNIFLTPRRIPPPSSTARCWKSSSFRSPRPATRSASNA